MFVNPLNKIFSVLELGRIGALLVLAIGLAGVFAYPMDWMLENFFDFIGTLLAMMGVGVFYVSHKSLSLIEERQDATLKYVADKTTNLKKKKTDSSN